MAVNQRKRHANFIHFIRQMKSRYALDLRLDQAVEFSELVRDQQNVIARTSRTRRIKKGYFYGKRYYCYL